MVQRVSGGRGRPAMVFAAGLGARMRPLTLTRPKPLVEVAGRALIDYALDHTRAVGAAPVVVNVHYLPEMMRAHLRGCDVVISDESAALLETGGGLREALPLLCGSGDMEPVFTINSDVVWDGPNPLAVLDDAWDSARMDALLLCLPPAQIVGRCGGGDFLRGGDGRLVRGRGEIYAGAHLICPEFLRDVPEAAFSLNVVWDQMIARGRLFGVPYPGRWCDVGHVEGIAAAEAMLAGQEVGV